MTSDRRELKKKYGSLFDTVSALLFENDPIGINFGDNPDEYDPETGTILPKLASAKSVEDVQFIVHAEFCRWFEEGNAGSREIYAGVSVKIWDAWRAAFPAAITSERRDDPGSRDE